MANLGITIGSDAQIKTTESGGVHTPHHIVDQSALPDGASSETTLEAVRAAVAALAAALSDGALSVDTGLSLGGLATDAAIATLIGHVDGLEAALTTLNGKNFATEVSLAAVLAKIIAAPATEAKQDSTIAGQETIGTRAYGAAATRLAYGGSSAQSAAIVGTEVLLHNCGGGRCYVAAGSGPTATADDIPLEPGEKFHMRITSGHKIAALQDDAAGNLNIIPVA